MPGGGREPPNPLAAKVALSPDIVEQRARRIVAEFSALADPIDRYRRLVELGEAMPGLAAEERTEANRLPGCQYAVWVCASYDPRREALHFRADSDAKITRGLAALILQVFDGLSPRHIMAADVGFLDAIGLREQLSVHRGNGLSALIEEIHGHARRHLHSEQASA